MSDTDIPKRANPLRPRLHRRASPQWLLFGPAAGGATRMRPPRRL
jgi:hypothetical protein